jgi:hypothetical protein
MDMEPIAGGAKWISCMEIELPFLGSVRLSPAFPPYGKNMPSSTYFGKIVPMS